MHLLCIIVIQCVRAFQPMNELELVMPLKGKIFILHEKTEQEIHQASTQMIYVFSAK